MERLAQPMSVPSQGHHQGQPPPGNSRVINALPMVSMRISAAVGIAAALEDAASLVGMTQVKRLWVRSARKPSPAINAWPTDLKRTNAASATAAAMAAAAGLAVMTTASHPGDPHVQLVPWKFNAKHFFCLSETVYFFPQHVFFCVVLVLPLLRY